MIRILKNDRNLTWIIPIVAALLVAVGFWWKGDLADVSLLIALTCGIVLVLLTLFARFSWYYYALIAVIPVSLEMGIIGGARLSFPAEGMVVLLIPTALLFNRTYRQKLGQILMHPLAFLLIVDLFFLLFISFFSTHIDVSLKRVLIRLLFFFGFFITVQLFEDKKKLIWPWIFYSIGLIPVMFFTLKNHIHHDFNPRVVFNICAPYYNDHTVYGACLAFIIPMLTIILVKRRLFNISRLVFSVLLITFIFILISEVLALSRAALLSIIFAGVFALLLKYRVRFMHLMVGLLIAGGVVWGMSEDIYSSIEQNESVSNDGELINHFSSVTNVNSDASNLERINRWICAWRMYEKKPLTGFGPGTYQFEYNQFQTIVNKTYISTNTGDRGNAHSEYLTYLSETGIIGLLIFIGIVLGSVYLGMKNHYLLVDPALKALNLGVLLGLITFFFHGLFNSFIDQSKMAFLVFTALGTLVWISNNGLKLEQKSEE